MTEYTVRPHDTLYKIAARYLGSGSRWPNLWWSNRGLLSDPNQIRGGQRLAMWRWQKGPVPAAIEAAAVRAMGPAVVTVPASSPAPAGASPPPPPAPLSGGGGDFRQYALSLFGQYGWDSGQMGCLDPLWNRESGWSPTAANRSGAYGIPQALPGDKMASAGPDWQTDGDTQIRWGEGYIKSTYGTPCGAWDHELAQGWY